MARPVAAPAPEPLLRRSEPVLRARGRLLGLARRVRLDVAVVVVALLGAMALLLVETPIAVNRLEAPVTVAFLLVLVHAGALPLAVRVPNVAAGLALAAALVLQLLSEQPAGLWPWWPVLIVTQTLVLAGVATRAGRVATLVHWLLAVGLSSVLAGVLRPTDGGATAANLVVYGGVSGAVTVAALVAVQWRLLRDELLAERRLAADEAARLTLMEERTRIARELHDVIAHSMSIITVQSTTARFRNPGFDEAAIDEFEQIGALSRQALDEMRGLLRVLRGSDRGADRRPQPGVADLPALVGHAARAGTRVTFEPVEDGAGISEVTGLAAFRIVQEALSNAIRHAPGAEVEVRCERDAGALVVSVVNGPPTAVPVSHGTDGHGLIGMAERATSVGGEVRCRPSDEGGFVVRAVLPVRAPRAAVPS